MNKQELLSIISQQGQRLNELDDLRIAYLLQRNIHENYDASMGERLHAAMAMNALAQKILDAILAWESVDHE
jgi:hypothetical protein